MRTNIALKKNIFLVGLLTLLLCFGNLAYAEEYSNSSGNTMPPSGECAGAYKGAPTPDPIINSGAPTPTPTSPTLPPTTQPQPTSPMTPTSPPVEGPVTPAEPTPILPAEPAPPSGKIVFWHGWISKQLDLCKSKLESLVVELESGMTRPMEDILDDLDDVADRLFHLTNDKYSTETAPDGTPLYATFYDIDYDGKLGTKAVECYNLAMRVLDLYGGYTVYTLYADPEAEPGLPPTP